MNIIGNVCHLTTYFKHVFKLYFLKLYKYTYLSIDILAKTSLKQELNTLSSLLSINTKTNPYF